MMIIDTIQMGPYTLIKRVGMEGWFTENQALGAWKNSTRIEKVNSEPGDGTPNGVRGVVLGSMLGVPDVAQGAVAYFVQWDNRPGYAVLCMGSKLKAVGPATAGLH